VFLSSVCAVPFAGAAEQNNTDACYRKNELLLGLHNRAEGATFFIQVKIC